jgi:branched-chain amino acid transport system ATP-binding protein
MVADVLLDIRDVHTYRGNAYVLRGVSLHVGAGEVVALVGRNGAGKTTTMESIMGLLPVRAGRITFAGRDLTRLGPHERARLGLAYAPEDAGIFPDLTVAENLSLGLWLGGTPRGDGQGTADAPDRRRQVFQLFPHLEALLDRRGLHLSGGEKKMLAIARAMALGPRLLLLDESFEGLAPVVVQRFADAVLQIRAMGVSLLVAESNVMTASRVAQRLYVIDRGEIIFEGSPQQAFEDAEVMRTIRG